MRDRQISAEGARLIAAELKDNQVIKELNIANNKLSTDTHGVPDLSGVVAIADSIRTMVALVKFDISNNKLNAAGGKALAEALHGNQVMTELNLSSNELGSKGDFFNTADLSGVSAISNAIPTMGALTHLDISRQTYKDRYGDTVGGIGAEGAKAIAEALKSNVSGLDL